jgi:hypothetical protein
MNNHNAMVALNKPKKPSQKKPMPAKKRQAPPTYDITNEEDRKNLYVSGCYIMMMEYEREQLLEKVAQKKS